MAKKDKLPILYTMLFPVFDDENGEEQIAFTKDVNEQYSALGDILYVFPSMTDATLYYSELQEQSLYMFKRAYYVQAYYTEVIALSLELGTETGVFCSCQMPSDSNPIRTDKIYFPDNYGLDIKKFDMKKSSTRIMNYLQTPISFEDFIRKTCSKDDEDLVDKVYTKTNEYLSHFVALNDDIRLLGKYKEEFFEYFKHGQYKQLLDVVEEFEYYMSEIEEAISFAKDDETIGDFLYNLLDFPKAYGANLKQKFKEDDQYYKVIAAHATAIVIMKNKTLEEFNADDLIDLAYLFKTNFGDEYIEMLIDFFANYAIFNILKFKESDFFETKYID